MSTRPASYVTFDPVPYDKGSSASLGIQLYRNNGIVTLYIGVLNSPVPDDPSTYFLRTAYDTALSGSTGPYISQPIYVSTSTCSLYSAYPQPCTIVILAVTNVGFQNLYLQPMSSGSNIRLQKGQPAKPASNATSLSSTFQFSLPTSTQADVQLTVTTTSPVSVWCSYQYVTPDATFNEWQWKGVGTGSTPSSRGTTYVPFTWNPNNVAQRTNANTVKAVMANTCYCTIQATSFDSYTIAYTYSIPQPYTPPNNNNNGNRRDGLSRAAFVAVIAVPVIAVTLLLVVLALWWMRRRGGSGMCCCRGLFMKGSKSIDNSWILQRLNEADEGDMAEMEGQKTKQARDSRQIGKRGFGDTGEQ